MTRPALDLDLVRSNFPGLARGWTLFDNAGGSQILKGAVDRMTEFLYEKNVQIGGSYEVSLAAAEALREARAAAATLMNAGRPEEIVFGPSTTVLLQNLAARHAQPAVAGRRGDRHHVGSRIQHRPVDVACRNSASS